MIEAVLVATFRAYPVASTLALLTFFYLFLLDACLFWLRRLLFFVLGRRGLGKHVLVTNSATVPVFVSLFDSQGFLQMSTPARLAPGAKTSLALSKLEAYKGEPVLAWSEQLADMRKGGQSFRWRSVGVALSRNLRDLEFVLCHPMAGTARHMGDVVLVTSFEQSVLGRLDKTLRSNPLLSAADAGGSGGSARPEAAKVERTRGVCEAEQSWLAVRDQHTSKALAKLLGRKSAERPCRIALFSSGGGVRAMVALAGALDGLDKADILPAVTYVGAVSGSCWGLSFFMRERELMPDAPMRDVIEKTQNDMRHRLSLPLLPALADSAKLVLRAAARKIRNLQSQSLVTAYGAILAAAWPTSDTLSAQAPCVLRGTCPLPLYAGSSIDFESKRVVTLEFSPLACRYEDAHIPTWAVGRRFDRGESTTLDPELPMEELLGMFGSAFCTTVEKICENAFWVGSEGAAKLKAFVRETAVELAWTGLKTKIETVGVANRDVALSIPLVYPLHLNNWAFDSESRRHTPLTLPVFDAGIDCNICWSFASRRDIDLIVALDSSDDVAYEFGCLTLDGLSKQRQYELDEFGATRLPEVNRRDMHAETIRVFGSRERGEIVVVFIPTKPYCETEFQIQTELGARGFANTANFLYTPAQFDKLYNMSRNNMLHHAKTIVAEIDKLA